MNSCDHQQSNRLRLYESLGQIIVSFDVLEKTIEAIIFCSTSTSVMQARVLCGNMTFSTKINTMGSTLCELHMDAELGDVLITLNELIERSNYCERQRNNLVRAYWVPELASELDAIYRLRSDGNEEKAFGLEKVPLSVLDNFVVFLNSTASCLHAFYQHLLVRFGQLRDYQSFNEYFNTPLKVSNDPN